MCWNINIFSTSFHININSKNGFPLTNSSKASKISPIEKSCIIHILYFFAFIFPPCCFFLNYHPIFIKSFQKKFYLFCKITPSKYCYVLRKCHKTSFWGINILHDHIRIKTVLHTCYVYRIFCSLYMTDCQSEKSIIRTGIY